MSELTEILARKEQAARALGLSMACLKLSLPDQLFADHAAALNAYLEAENDFAKALDAKLAVVHQRVKRL